MKIALTLILGMAVSAAFANCCAGGGCGPKIYNAKALDAKDAEFLAMANAMAAKVEGKAAKSCCKDMKGKSSKKAKKGAKVAMAAKSCCKK